MFILDPNKVLLVTVKHRRQIQHDMAEISSFLWDMSSSYAFFFDRLWSSTLSRVMWQYLRDFFSHILLQRNILAEVHPLKEQFDLEVPLTDEWLTSRLEQLVLRSRLSVLLVKRMQIELTQVQLGMKGLVRVLLLQRECWMELIKSLSRLHSLVRLVCLDKILSVKNERDNSHFYSWGV